MLLARWMAVDRNHSVRQRIHITFAYSLCDLIPNAWPCCAMDGKLSKS